MAYSFVKTDCNSIKNSLISLLHLQLYDREHDKEYQLTSKNDVIANGGKTVNGNCAYDNIAATYDSYFTKDGAFILFSRTDGVNNGPFIILDVNGRKGPNKWGYDVFFMTLSKRDRSGSLEQKIYLTDEYCSLAEKGGRLPRTILQNKDVTEAGDFGWFWK